MMFHITLAAKFLRGVFIFRLHGNVKAMLMRGSERLDSVSSPVRHSVSSLSLLLLHSCTYFITLGCLVACLIQQTEEPSFYTEFLRDTIFVVLSGATVGYSALGGNYGLMVFVMMLSIGFFGVFVGKVRKLMAKLDHLRQISRGVDEQAMDAIRILTGCWGNYVRNARHDRILTRIVQSHQLYLIGQALMPNLNKVSQVTGKGHLFKAVIGSPFEEFESTFSYLEKCIGQDCLLKLYCESELRV